MITARDRGFTLGDGLFETVLALDGQLVDWPAHYGRLTRGCAVLGLPAPEEEECLAGVKEALAELAGRAAVRLSWSAGEGGRGLDRPAKMAARLHVTAAAAPAPTEALRLAIVDVRRNDGSPASRLKTLAYLDNVLARREAQARGADEGLMLNTRGELACAAAGNLFWLSGRALFTPALECGVLDGTVRARLIAAGAAHEVRAGPEALEHADAVLVTSSLAGVRAVAAIDGRGFDSDRAARDLVQAIGWEG